MRKLGFIGVLALAVSAFAGTKTLVNADKDGVGIKGYDPVAYFTQNQPVKGNPQFQSTHNGVKYYFASQANKSAFDANPGKYEPQFGGFCAYAASRGHTAKIEPDAFQIVDGRLLLQYDKSVRDTFNKDTRGNLRKADENWPQILEKYGK